MLKYSRYYWIVFLCLPCLAGLDSCFGVGEFFRGAAENSPTEPCVERVSSPTPVQVLSPLPESPDPQRTPLISAGTPAALPPVEQLPTPVQSAKVTTRLNSGGKCFGNLVPTGTREVPLGTTFSLTVIIDIGALFCWNCYIVVDGAWSSFPCPAPGGSYTYGLKITEDHIISVELQP